jgi:Flp pilus assembly protein TadG
MQRRSPCRNGRRGTAMIEFALSFSLLWALFTGVFQFGYSMYVYNRLLAAVDQGARYASRVDFDSPNHTFVGKVQNMVVYGNPQGTGNKLLWLLNKSNVDVTWTADAAGLPKTITVSVKNFSVPVIFTTFNFNNKPRVTMKYTGLYKS